MFNQVQDRALAGPLKDLQKLVLKSLLRCLGCVLTIVVLLEGEPLSFKDLSVLCAVHLSLNPDHSTIKAWLVECCRDGCPSGSFSYLHRGTLELCQSDHRVLGHLPDQGPSLPIAQFGCAASSRKTKTLPSKLLPFKNDGGDCVLRDLLCCRHFLVPFPRSVPQHNPVSELYRQFL